MKTSEICYPTCNQFSCGFNDHGDCKANPTCDICPLTNTVQSDYVRDQSVSGRDQSAKADKDKLRMELIPVSAYESLGRVLTHGAKKYGPDNWRLVETDRFVGALLRHLIAFLKDPNGVDADSGLKHTDHLLANAVFINEAVQRGDYEAKV